MEFETRAIHVGQDPDPATALGRLAITAALSNCGRRGEATVRQVMDMGSLSIIVDPTGAMLGFWMPKKR